MVHGDKGGLELPVVENRTTTDLGKVPANKDDSFEIDKHQADESRRIRVEDVERLRRDDAAALVRPAPKRYKNFKTRKKLVPITKVLKELQEEEDKEEVRPSGEAALAFGLVLPPQPGENGTGWNMRQTISLALEDFKDLQRIRRNTTKDIVELEPMTLRERGAQLPPLRGLGRE